MFPSSPQLRRAGFVILVALVAIPSAASTLTIPATGTSAPLAVTATGTSAAGTPVSFTATFTVSGSTLGLVLVNTSLVPTRATADVLSSFYFDVFQDGVPATLTLSAAAGPVYEVRRNDLDVFVPGGLPGGATNLRAVSKGDGTWQGRAMDSALAPGLGYGIGTVGNSAYRPNGFDPQVVDQADYTIYSTGTQRDIDPVGNLAGRLLVRGTASFQFTGLDPKRPVEVVDTFVFGLGTSPDSVIVVMPEPEPVALVMTGLAGTMLGWLPRLRRRAAASRPRRQGSGSS